MSISDRKFIWWQLFASCAGMSLVLLAALIDTIAHQKNAKLDGVLIYLIGLSLEGIFVLLAVEKLKRCYTEQPLYWTGRWQLSLSDMLSIVFFFALVMSIFHTLDSDRAFLRTGLPISMLTGAGYVVALLISARKTHLSSAPERWCLAIAYLIGSLAYVLLAVLAQFAAFAFIGVLILFFSRLGNY